MTVRILLIEDDPDTASRLVDDFVAEGFEVTHAWTGELGLTLFHAGSFEAIVLNYHLPAMTGLEVLAELRRHRPDVSVVFITATGRPEIAAEALHAGAFACVEKHLKYPPIVIERVRDAIAGRSIRSSGPLVMRSVFVGREAELKLLTEALDDVRDGRGRLVFLVGEAGVGKSTLGRRLADFARRERTMVPLFGRCRALEGSPAYGPWIAIYQSLQGWLKENSRTVLPGEGTAYLERLVPQVAAEVPDRWDAALVESSAAKLERFDRVIRVLRELAAERCVVLMLDDAHAIDSASLELFEFLAERLRDARILVVAMLRTEGIPERRDTIDELLRIGRDVDAMVMDVRPFSRQELATFVAAATGWTPNDETVSALFEKTEGHPLFTDDVVRLLVAGRRLGTQPAVELVRAVPASRLSAVKQRLRFLPTPHRELLAIAALIGRQFDVAILRGAAGALADRVDEAVTEASAHGVIVESGEPHELRFAYELLRDVLIDELPKIGRADAHARIGAAIEREHAGGLQAHLTKLAHHFLEAGRYGDPRHGIDYAIQAGDREALLMAYPEAARLYEGALRADGRSGVLGLDRRLGVLLKLADVRWRRGELEVARAVGREAIETARALDDGELLAKAVLAFAGQLPAFVSVTTDREVAAAIDEALARVGETSPQRPVLLVRLAEEQLFSSGADPSELVAEARRLHEIAGDTTLGAVTLRTDQWAPKPEIRRAHAQRAIALGARTKDRVLELDGILLGVWSALEYGALDEAQQHLHTYTRLARSFGLRQYSYLAALTDAAIAIDTADPARARTLVEQAFRLGQELGSPNAPLFYGAQSVRREWLSGGFDTVLGWIDTIGMTYPGLRDTVAASRAITFSEMGRLDEAGSVLDEVAARGLAAMPRNLAWPLNFAYLGEAAARTGRTDHASVLYELLLPFAEYHVILPPMFCYGPVAHQLGILAATLGRTEAAERHFQAALASEERMRSAHWIARTKIEYAHLLARLPGSEATARAAALREDARSIAERLELPGILRRCEGLVSVADADGGSVHHCVFRPEGEGWLVGEDGVTKLIKDIFGMRYIYELLLRPGHRIPCEILDGLAHGGVAVFEPRGDAMLDPRAVRDLRERWRELEAELDEATANNDLGRMDGIQREKARIEDALTAGRRPQLPGTSDILRPRVWHAIARAKKKIARQFRGLGDHLRHHVLTGADCVYSPHGRWIFEL